MVTVVTLPPQETPKQPTACRRPQDLEEHLLAFLNNNNKEGFVGDTKVIAIELMAVQEIMALEDATLADLLMLLTEHEYIGRVQFKKLAGQIQKNINESTGRKTIKMGRAYELLSRLFGYKTHAALCALVKLRDDGLVRNFRCKKKEDIQQIFAEEAKVGKYRGMPEVRQAFKQLRK